MKIIVASVMVDDQAKALKFYTEVLGFIKKTDIPLGEFRWLTVVSPDAPEGVELVLEPNAHPLAKTFQKGWFDAGMPLTVFGVADIQKEYGRMKGLGVVFRNGPTKQGPVTIATFEDTCGNIIQMVQQ